MWNPFWKWGPAALAIAAIAGPGASLISAADLTGTVSSSVSTFARPSSSPRQTPSNYKLGSDDQLTIRVSDVDEFANLTVRVDAQGDIKLPLIGYVHVASLTTHDAESLVRGRLEKYVQDPEVFVSVEEFRSQPISVLGAVRSPGVHELEGRKRLFEVLSLAGGLSDDAGYRIAITRRLAWGRVPLPNAHDDPTAQFSVASLNVKAILDGTRPQDNVDIMPEDVISVPKAEMIYVVGAVNKAGAFTLGNDQTVSALQAISLAEGMVHGRDDVAAPQRARILRVSPGRAARAEIPINLRDIMQKRAPDVPMMAGDILFVPVSKVHTVTARVIETALQAATMSVYRIPLP